MNGMNRPLVKQPRRLVRQTFHHTGATTPPKFKATKVFELFVTSFRKYPTSRTHSRKTLEMNSR